MPSYIFILGKNWNISIAEIVSFIKRPRFSGKIIDFSKTAALVEIEKKISHLELIELQELLGGTQKIATYLGEIETKLFLQAFPFQKAST